MLNKINKERLCVACTKFSIIDKFLLVSNFFEINDSQLLVEGMTKRRCALVVVVWLVILLSMTTVGSSATGISW